MQALVTTRARAPRRFIVVALFTVTLVSGGMAVAPNGIGTSPSRHVRLAQEMEHGGPRLGQEMEHGGPRLGAIHFNFHINGDVHHDGHELEIEVMA